MLLFQNEKISVPVLCYHNILEKEGKSNQLFISQAQLAKHLKILHDSGYTSVTPDDLYNHYLRGTVLPDRPVMISFDDSRSSQYHLAAPLLEQYHFRAVFFVMTVTLNKQGYLSASQLQDLIRRGHVIGAHTYDHPNLAKLKSSDWNRQIRQPKQLLENITGQPVNAFAYPYGVHTVQAITQLREAGYTTAFKLIDTAPCNESTYCIRRLMPNGNWSPATLLKELRRRF